MKDVAREAGVSISTVSHVLNKTRNVIPETKLRVDKAITKLSFEPSSLARALKTNRTYTLGMLASNSTNPFFMEVLQGVEEACFERGYSLILCNSNYKADRLLAQLKTLIKKRVDALIVLTTHDAPEFEEYLNKQKELPVVILDAKSVHNCCTISDNSVLGGRLATDYLIEQGHVNIACLTGPEAHPRSNDRLLGFKGTMEKHDLPVLDKWMVPAALTVQGGYEAMNKLFNRCASGALPQAIFAFNDMMALGAYRAIQERGLRIPEDISIIGYDDLELVSYLNPPLTTIRQPRQQLGEQAADLLINYLQTKTPMPDDLVLTPELVVRQSVKLRDPDTELSV